MNAVIIHVSAPPSLNKLWSHPRSGGRIRSAGYRAWAKVAAWEIRSQYVGQAPIACRYDMEILVPISRRDTGNWEKSISDAMQACGVVTNDGNCHRLIVEPTDRTDCLVTLTLRPELSGIRQPQAPKIKRRKPTRKRAIEPEALGDLL